MQRKVLTPLQKDCYDFYIIIQKNFSQILRHSIRLFNNKIGFCSKYSWVQKYIARMQKFIVSMCCIVEDHFLLNMPDYGAIRQFFTNFPLSHRSPYIFVVSIMILSLTPRSSSKSCA